MVRVIDPCAQERGFGLVVGIFMLSIIILFYVVVLDLSVAKRDHLRRQFDAINAADAAYHNINFKDAALSSASWGLDLATGMSKPYAKPIETTQALPGGLSATLTYTENSPKADHIGVALSGQLGLLDGFLGLISSIDIAAKANATGAARHLISFADISRSLTSDANIYLMLSAIGSNYNFKASPDPITNPEPTLEQQLLLPLSSLEYDIPAHGGKTPINPATAPDPYSVSVLTKHFDTAIADPSSLPHGTWKGPPWYIDPSIYDAGVTTPQSPEVANPGVVPPSMISYLRNHYTDVKIAYSLALESYLYAVSNIFDSLDFYIFAAASTGGGVVGKTVPEEDELDEYLNGVFPIIKSEQGPLLTTALLPNTFQMRNIVDYEHGGNATKQIGVLFDAQGASQMAFGDQWLPGSLEYDAFYADVSSIPGGGVAGALTMKQIGMCKSLEGPTLVWNPEWPDPTPQYMKRGISPTNVVQGPSFRVSRYGGNYIGPGITSNFAPCVARHFVAKPGGTDTLGVLREAAARTTAVRATNPDIQVGIAIITDGIPNLPVSGTPGDPASEPYLADIGYVAMHPVDWDSQLFPALKAEKTKLKNLKVNVFTLFVDTEINQPQSEIDKRDDYLNLMNDPDNGFYLVYLKVLSSSGTSDAIAVVDQLESAIQAFAALMQSVAIIYTHQYSGG